MDFIITNQDNATLIEVEKLTNARSGDIVDQLISIRNTKQMTQQDIADTTGMCRANVSRIEQKKYTPTLEVLMRYANALGYEIELTLKEKEQ